MIQLQKTKTYTEDGLIVVPRDVLLSLDEAVENLSKLEIMLEKINGLEDIEDKDKELWKYFTYNEKGLKNQFGTSIAMAFVTGGLFTYTVLEIANEPTPLTKLKKETIHKYNKEVEIYPNPIDYIKYVRKRINSENPILYKGVEFISNNFFSTEEVSSSYNSGVFGTYELLRLSIKH